MNLKIGSLAGFALAVVAILYLVHKEYVFSKNVITIIIQVLAVALMIWSRLTFGLRSFHASANTTKGELITTGPFQWFRHPIYASVIFFFIGSLISFPFIETTIALIAIITGLFIRMLFEEQSLRETYKEQYEEYSRRTKRIIPFVF